MTIKKGNKKDKINSSSKGKKYQRKRNDEYISYFDRYYRELIWKEHYEELTKAMNEDRKKREEEEKEKRWAQWFHKSIEKQIEKQLEEELKD